MASKNTNLHSAKKAKNDEFYTQLSDIEKEMAHYKDFFKGKIVYCNCDDARESNFFQYFTLNFEYLGLKKLITTGYKENGKGVKLVYEGDKNGNFMADDEEIVVTELEGSGDFRSEECIELLKECDVVVTNPPFSLFREYVAQLMKYGKKFLIIGNKNAITYKDIFPYIKNNELWLGITNPDEYRLPNGEITQSVKGLCRWFTNIPHNRRNAELDLYKKYSTDEYPKYDNYDAIEVSKVTDIPMDYEGAMGVPITFLDKYCPTQFEIIWTTDRGGDGMLDELKLPHTRYDAPVINGKGLYKRIFIRRKIKNTNTSTDNGTEVANTIADNTSNNKIKTK